MRQVLRCTVRDSHDSTHYLDGDRLVHVRLPDGRHVERRASLGYSPPFLQILPCPYCGVAEDRGYDLVKHIDTHLRTEMAP